MALFNHTTRDLTAKIVFYGPGLGGKTTNLRMLHGQLDRAAKGKLLSLATAQDRTIYFDLLPVELGNIKGYTVRYQLCTVPGQVFYNETRKIVLRGVDGVVFVVDSQASMLTHNLESFQNLRENLREEKIALESIPVVIQYNKRDLPSALPIASMQEALGFSPYPFVEAVAAEGRGVLETFRLISKLTFVDLLRRLQKGPAVASVTAAAALAAVTEAVPALAAPESTETVFVPPEPQAAAPAPPAAVDKQVTLAEPVAVEAPSTTAGPVRIEAPVVTAQPVAAEPPVTTAESVTVETPVMTAQPAAEETPIATAETVTFETPVTTAEPVDIDKPPADGPLVAASSSGSASEPSPEAGAESSASPVFEEFETDREPDGWSATLTSGFPGIDDEPSRDSPPATPERTAGPDLGTTLAIGRPSPVLALPPTAEPAPAAEPLRTTEPAPVPEEAAPPPGEVATPSEDETRQGHPAPDEVQARSLEESLTRAIRSISEESTRREEVEARLGGRIATLEEELAALRRELAESRSREESMRSLTEALNRRWDSLRRILSEDQAPPA